MNLCFLSYLFKVQVDNFFRVKNLESVYKFKLYKNIKRTVFFKVLYDVQGSSELLVEILFP